MIGDALQVAIINYQSAWWLAVSIYAPIWINHVVLMLSIKVDRLQYGELLFGYTFIYKQPTRHTLLHRRCSDWLCLA